MSPAYEWGRCQALFAVRRAERRLAQGAHGARMQVASAARRLLNDASMLGAGGIVRSRELGA